VFWERLEFFGDGMTKDQNQHIISLKLKKHCKKLLLIYKGMDEQDMEIISTIEKYKRHLNK